MRVLQDTMAASRRFLANAFMSPGEMGRRPRLAACAALFVVALGFALAFQGSRGIWEPDEGRYTVIAMQMLRSGDFLHPAYNNMVPHYAKPPLTYWGIAGGVALLGRNEWGARLYCGVAFAVTILVVLALARTVAPARPWLPPLVYATSLFPFAAANVATTDTLLTLWEAVAVLGFVRWRAGGGQRRRWRFLMWTGFALAFLTKGPPGLLPLLAILVFVALADGWRAVPRLAGPLELLLFVLVGLGWYGTVICTRPDLAIYFVRDEVVRRVASSSFDRNPQWYKPLTLYLPALVAGMLPWVLPLAQPAFGLRRRIVSRRWWVPAAGEDHAWAVFLALWFLLPLAVFCLSRSKLPLYVLPLFLPMALAAGRLLPPGSRLLTRPALLLLWAVLLLGAKAGVGFCHGGRDSRILARAIAKEVSPPPAGLVFVNTHPAWGLSLYLNCEVEAAFTGSIVPAPPLPRLPLADVLAQRGPGTLLVIPEAKLDGAAADLRALGYQPRTVAVCESMALVSLDAERPPSN